MDHHPDQEVLCAMAVEQRGAMSGRAPGHVFAGDVGGLRYTSAFDRPYRSPVMMFLSSAGQAGRPAPTLAGLDARQLGICD